MDARDSEIEKIPGAQRLCHLLVRQRLTYGMPSQQQHQAASLLQSVPPLEELAISRDAFEDYRWRKARDRESTPPIALFM
jgi:hypothetical protein